MSIRCIAASFFDSGAPVASDTPADRGGPPDAVAVSAAGGPNMAALAVNRRQGRAEERGVGEMG